jgi:hypothetical protein
VPGRIYIDGEVIPVLDQVSLWPATNKNLAREDLANQTLASRLKRQKRAGDAAIRQKRLKAELQQRKLLEEIGFD